MIRSNYYLYPAREPTPLRQAVTLLLVREAANHQGFEILLSRRAANARFMPNVFVFPGGSIDPEDAQQAHMADTRPDQDEHAITLGVAAARESLEELGILLARKQGGAWVTDADIRQCILRNQPLLPQMQKNNWRFALDDMYKFAHWITDRDIPKRFDVPFLLARMPEQQVAEPDNQEQFDPLWLTPGQALDRQRQGDLPMVFPTIRTLQAMADFGSIDSIFAACKAQSVLPTSTPRSGYLFGKLARFMEHEAPFAELEMVCPDGQLQHDVGWQSEKPTPLLRHVTRLTAPNGNRMTGPGTNTYLIGEPSTGYIVMDPGPWGTEADTAHLERVMATTNGAIKHIVCTHSHPDHSPAARPLQSLVQAAGHARPEIWGMPSANTSRTDSQFSPDRAMQHGDVLRIESTDGQQPAISHTLQAIHTPGHAANHLCFMLLEDALLFSGDHILGTGSPVILPPDGGMDAYLNSLDILAEHCQSHQTAYILPAHGHVLNNPQGTIAQLREHRRLREQKVLQALQIMPNGSVDDWLGHAYANTPKEVWPAARYSFWAHAQRLAKLHPELADLVESAFAITPETDLSSHADIPH